MEDGQTHPNVCRSMNLSPLIVFSQCNCRKKKLSYSSSKFLEKREKLLSSWVDFFNQIYIPLTQDVITDKAKSIVEDIKIKKEGADETFLVIKVWFT